MTTQKKIIVGLSGGMDSAVCAALLSREGWDVLGVHLSLLPNHGVEERHLRDARLAAEKIGVPFQEIDASPLFEERILRPFIEEYLSGRTPNPCITCNPEVKFHCLLKEARRIDADHVASGHYTRVEFDKNRGRWIIKRGKDRRKDQSYFLARLKQHQLEMLKTPLGELKHQEVRDLAQNLGLASLANKPSSREICFIAGNYQDFLKSRPETAHRLVPGDIVDKKGNVLGQHGGIALFTIGQRSGLGISYKHPLYVLEIDAGNNRLVVGTKQDCYSSLLEAGDLNWVALQDLSGEISAEVQIRYRRKAAPARIKPIPGQDKVNIEFEKPQLAITPGQTAVIYQEEVVLGAGTILKARSKLGQFQSHPALILYNSHFKEPRGK